MSFWDIPDPVERERIVRDYERIKREIQERREKWKISALHRDRTLQKVFHPIVKAQADMSEKIVQSLRENNPKRETRKHEEEIEENHDDVGPLESSYRNRYML